MAQRHPTPVRTYGWGRGTILAALANAVVLLLGCGAIAVEALQPSGREPAPLRGSDRDVGGGARNRRSTAATALMFMRGRRGDLNVRAAFQHMAADAAVSAGVVASGLLIALTGWRWLDPATSLLIVAIIDRGTRGGTLRQSADLALDAVPDGVDMAGAGGRRCARCPAWWIVHDLHVWGLSTTQTALTAHLVGGDVAYDPALVRSAPAPRCGSGSASATRRSRSRQSGVAEHCELRPAHVV